LLLLLLLLLVHASAGTAQSMGRALQHEGMPLQLTSTNQSLIMLRVNSLQMTSTTDT
jgi:hypothetical protein